MDWKTVLEKLRSETEIIETRENARDEVYITVASSGFARACCALHKLLNAPVAMMWATDERSVNNSFGIWCGFRAPAFKRWVFARTSVSAADPRFEGFSRTVYSASLFEREIKEMFGIEPAGSPDLRRLRLHSEVWPEGFYPLRKDFKMPPKTGGGPDFPFARGEGEGIFEVPVGPVHAGIIGPGHFRFSVAGEPIINLEIRLGFTHRGAEKAFEGKGAEAVRLAECVSGDAAFAHSLAFCRALEKIYGLRIPARAQVLRAVFLELERLYNHAADMGGIAVDVGFSFPAALAQTMKENIQRLSAGLTGSRFLKGLNVCGGVTVDIGTEKMPMLLDALRSVEADFFRLKDILLSSVSFMDRVDSTGVLKKKTAQDLGITGLAARASGIDRDLRLDFLDPAYEMAGFKTACEQTGDVLARLKVRFQEFEESLRVIRALAEVLPDDELRAEGPAKAGYALGYAEGWRGPALYWVRTDEKGLIDRCKVYDASSLNWQGLAYCVLGDIIPDFPVCNKSFDLSYSGNDL